MKPNLQGVTGRIVWPDSPDYDEVRGVFRGEVDKHLQTIVQVANSDVI